MKESIIDFIQIALIAIICIVSACAVYLILSGPIILMASTGNAAWLLIYVGVIAVYAITERISNR